MAMRSKVKKLLMFFVTFLPGPSLLALQGAGAEKRPAERRGRGGDTRVVKVVSVHVNSWSGGAMVTRLIARPRGERSDRTSTQKEAT